MDERDILILKYLAKGVQIGQIPLHFESDHSLTISKSYIEKRLTTLRKSLGAKSLFHLAVIVKNEKII